MTGTTIDDEPLTLPRELYSRIDRRAAAFVAGSVLIHAAIAVAAWAHDRTRPRPRALASAEVLEPAMVDLLTAPSFDPTAPTPDAPEPGAAIPAPRSTPIAPAAPRHGGGRRPSLPELSPEDYIKAMHGGGGPGDLPALHAMPGVGDDDPSIGGDPDRGPRVRGPMGPGGPDHPNLPDVPDVDSPDKGPERPPSRDPHPDPVPDPPIDRDWIADVVHTIETTYMPGLQRCQKKLMATDPLATSMTVKVSFTVGEDGRVGSHAARSDAATVSECIEGLMAGWRLPAPPSGKDANVAVKLALQGA